MHDLGLYLLAYSILEFFVLNKELYLPLYGRIPMILNCIVSSAWQKLGYDCPSVSKTMIRRLTYMR